MLELHFDFVSPYSYLAWVQNAELGARIGHEVEPVPVLFAGILGALGTKGPAEVPARRAYMPKDVMRKAHGGGITIAPPPAHPFNPLLALRIAVQPMEKAQRVRIIDALYAAAWRSGRGIDTPERVTAALETAGIDAAPLIARAAGAEAKDLLRQNTEKAIARGAFGVPTMFIGEEMFFGYDSFGAIEAYARGEDPVAQQPEMLARWQNLPAAAVRRAP